jgi:PTH1 family peptidyl-tRNA hydrolase
MIVGLGNPGKEYASNRHNVGFMTLDRLDREAGEARWSAMCQSLVRRMVLEGRSLALVKPQTYMNRSGVAVRQLLMLLGLQPVDLAVVLDDVNLPFGKIRIRTRGSGGGHRGLESILQELGTDEIARVRLGVGEEDMPEDKAGFVLADFPPDKDDAVQEMITRAAAALRTIASSGISRAMSHYNA